MEMKGAFRILIWSLIAFGIVIMIAVCIIASPAKADVFVYGSVPNYSAVVLPNCSYVHQGENISQGNWYDLRGVYGFSGQLAHWRTDGNSGVGTPDIIVDLNGEYLTYIDPSKYPAGRYWQWDGVVCDSAGLCKSGFGNGNAYVFDVVASTTPVVTPTPEKVVYHGNITMYTENGTVEIPVTAEATVIPEVTTQPPMGEVQTIIIPTTALPETTEPPAEMVTQPSPISDIIPLFALFIVGVCLWRNRQ
jgi:hypothetical protein